MILNYKGKYEETNNLKTGAALDMNFPNALVPNQ
jgi:hypothetical protein